MSDLSRSLPVTVFLSYHSFTLWGKYVLIESPKLQLLCLPELKWLHGYRCRVYNV